MVDNYEADLGSGGKTFASDQVGGIDFPRILPVFGLSDQAKTDVSLTNPLPVHEISARDDATLAIKTVTNTHHEIHEGVHFYVYDTATLANNQVLTIALTTPNTTKWGHLVWSFGASDAAMIDVLEDVTSYAGGTSFTPLNNNRNSATSSDMTSVVAGDTAGGDAITPTGGTEIWAEGIKSASKAGGVSRADDERELKQDSKYLFRLTSLANANVCNLSITWYEHVNAI